MSANRPGVYSLVIYSLPKKGELVYMSLDIGEHDIEAVQKVLELMERNGTIKSHQIYAKPRHCATCKHKEGRYCKRLAEHDVPQWFIDRYGIIHSLRKDYRFCPTWEANI